MALLTLGTVELVDFEVPPSVRFGGAQRVSVHKLIGGGRVIDAMGRDDSAVQWAGIMSGNDASDRARILDAMRANGSVVSLAWDVFCYNVMVTDLALKFHNPWWIEYRIQCTVVADLAQSSVAYVQTAADAIIADLTTAAGYSAVVGLLGPLPSAAGLVPGSVGVPAAILSLTSASTSISQSVFTAESNLDAADLSTVVSASGSLAQLAAAQGYVDRSLANLQGMSN